MLKALLAYPATLDFIDDCADLDRMDLLSKYRYLVLAVTFHGGLLFIGNYSMGYAQDKGGI